MPALTKVQTPMPGKTQHTAASKRGELTQGKPGVAIFFVWWV